LGRKHIPLKDIKEMGEGTIIELEKLAGEPLDVYANNVFIGKGEVVVIDENFGIRITEV
jgi:flagellar motor switch protein FliN/FliY